MNRNKSSSPSQFCLWGATLACQYLRETFGVIRRGALPHRLARTICSPSMAEEDIWGLWSLNCKFILPGPGKCRRHKIGYSLQWSYCSWFLGSRYFGFAILSMLSETNWLGVIYYRLWKWYYLRKCKSRISSCEAMEISYMCCLIPIPSKFTNSMSIFASLHNCT